MSSISGTIVNGTPLNRDRAATRSAPPGRFAAWAGILFLTLYLTLAQGSGWYGLYAVELRIFSLLSIALAFTIWAVVAWRDPGWRPTSGLWPATVAVLLAFAIGTVTSWAPRWSAIASERRRLPSAGRSNAGRPTRAVMACSGTSPQHP